MSRQRYKGSTRREAPQECFQYFKVNNNLAMLQSLMRSSSGTLFKRKCNALITILEILLVPTDYKVRIDDLRVKGEKVKGFMDFQDGLNIFFYVTELHDRIPISLLELSSSKIPSGGLLYNRILARHTSKKCVFKIYKWTAESLNSLCDLTSAVNPINILTD